MAEALQAPVDLTRDLAVGVIEAIHDVLDRAAFRRDVEILHRDEFSDGEAVVHLEHADLVPRLVDPGLFI